jgi:hypothetical protein
VNLLEGKQANRLIGRVGHLEHQMFVLWSLHGRLSGLILCVRLVLKKVLRDDL